MSRIHRARIVFAVLVAATLAAPPAWGQPMERPDGLARFSNAFGNLLTSLWEEIRCILNPHGGCSADSGVSAEGDAGCGLDPHGCTEGSEGMTQGDAGCILDPHGGCDG